MEMLVNQLCNNDSVYVSDKKVVIYGKQSEEEILKILPSDKCKSSRKSKYHLLHLSIPVGIYLRKSLHAII